MKNYTVRLYESGDREIWNAFLATAKNATFLFHRDFMEYHKDRFEDFSLLVFDEKKLVALLPANKKEDVVFSHQGLTYGGLVYSEYVKLETVIEAFKALLVFLVGRQITKLYLKLVPAIYHRKPAQELEYALFLAGASLVRRDTLSVIDMAHNPKYTDSRKEGIRKGKESNLEVREENNLIAFWNEILTPNLLQKHGAKPVHTLSEITALQMKFPKQIRQFNVYENNEIVAGTTVFESDRVAHSQYISANGSKSTTGSLDFLHDHLISNIFKDKAFFDFGISNEDNGRKLNKGLAFWKTGFGSGIVVQDFYEVNPKQYMQLEDVYK